MGLETGLTGAPHLHRITCGMAVRWFETSSRTAPGTANIALDLLAQILNHACACGHIAGNPVKGVARNPVRKHTRFLSREEIARLHCVLDRYAGGSASQAQQADIVRLLLLTGCRRGEIVRLRREEVKDGRLELADSKTGPGTVPLNADAQAILLRRMAHGNGPRVFPSVADPARHQHYGLRLWYAIRAEAGIGDVRLHDLRHTGGQPGHARGRAPDRHGPPKACVLSPMSATARSKRRPNGSGRRSQP